MTEAVVNSRDPLKVAAGRKGAQRRWGPPRRIHLGDMSPEQRRVVLAVIEAEREKNAKPESTPAK